MRPILILMLWSLFLSVILTFIGFTFEIYMLLGFSGALFIGALAALGPLLSHPKPFGYNEAELDKKMREIHQEQKNLKRLITHIEWGWRLKASEVLPVLNRAEDVVSGSLSVLREGVQKFGEDYEHYELYFEAKDLMERLKNIGDVNHDPGI